MLEGKRLWLLMMDTVHHGQVSKFQDKKWLRALIDHSQLQSFQLLSLLQCLIYWDATLKRVATFKYVWSPKNKTWIVSITWLVAALVIMINGYILLEFSSSEVDSIIYTSFVTVHGFVCCIHIRHHCLWHKFTP